MHDCKTNYRNEDNQYEVVACQEKGPCFGAGEGSSPVLVRGWITPMYKYVSRNPAKTNLQHEYGSTPVLVRGRVHPTAWS